MSARSLTVLCDSWIRVRGPRSIRLVIHSCGKIACRQQYYPSITLKNHCAGTAPSIVGGKAGSDQGKSKYIDR